MKTRSDIARDLAALGLEQGDAVMVHASMRAVGETLGGPDDVHLAIKDVIGESGTMLMYIGCPRYFDEVGRGNLTPDEEARVLKELPAFDAHTARAARDHGILAEFFRTFPGTLVTNHVTRMGAWGQHAAAMTESPPWDFTYGRGSALEMLVQLDGRILLLGSDFDNVTFLHHVEHVVDFPDKQIARFKVPVLVNGERVWIEMSEVDSSKGAHSSWPEDFFAQIVSGYLQSAAHARTGSVGNARAHLLSARELYTFAEDMMVRTARGEARIR